MIGWTRKFDVHNKYYMKFEHQNFRGNLSHIGPETEGLYHFYCTLNFARKLSKTGTMY